MSNRMVLVKEILGFDDMSVRSELVDSHYDQTEISVKWDGCCDIKLHSNGSTVSNPIDNEIDYFHICELKDFIDVLTEVYEYALEKGYEV